MTAETEAFFAEHIADEIVTDAMVKAAIDVIMAAADLQEHGVWTPDHKIFGAVYIAMHKARMRAGN